MVAFWRGRAGAIAGALSLAGREPVGSVAQPRTPLRRVAASRRRPKPSRRRMPRTAEKAPAPAPPPPAASVQTADPFGEEFTLEPKKVVVMKGTANWDAAFDTLIDAFKALTALLDKQGIKAIGQFDDRLHLDRRYRLHVPGRKFRSTRSRRT